MFNPGRFGQHFTTLEHLQNLSLREEWRVLSLHSQWTLVALWRCYCWALLVWLQAQISCPSSELVERALFEDHSEGARLFSVLEFSKVYNIREAPIHLHPRGGQATATNSLAIKASQLLLVSCGNVWASEWKIAFDGNNHKRVSC